VFDFSAPDGGSFECSLDGGGFTACSSPRTVHVAKGRHSFQARQAGFDATTANFRWTVASDAVVRASSTTNGITQTNAGHACGGPRGDWVWRVVNRGSALTVTYDLHWTFPPGSNTAPINGTGHAPPLNGLTLTITIVDGHLKSVASGNGFTGVAEADIVAKLVGSPAHPRITFVQSNLTGTVSGGGASVPFGTTGGRLGFLVHEQRFAGCP
jgi:hypothetical protein